MGNNSFAGCLELEHTNASNNFIMLMVFSIAKTFKTIYCNIKTAQGSYKINESIKIVGKHLFYLCDGLKGTIIPKSVVKLENNPSDVLTFFLFLFQFRLKYGADGIPL